MEKLDIPQGTLELMILTILAREPLHGYGISQRLAVLSHDQFQVNPGSLFPSLYRLEQDGKLKAEWRATENNRRAKYYRLTASGRRQLEQHRERWIRVSFAVTSVVGASFMITQHQPAALAGGEGLGNSRIGSVVANYRRLLHAVRIGQRAGEISAIERDGAPPGGATARRKPAVISARDPNLLGAAYLVRASSAPKSSAATSALAVHPT